MAPLEQAPFAFKSLRDLLHGPKWLIDESLAPDVAFKLSLAGHDAVAVASRTEMCGMADPQVLQLARAQQRVLVTADKDFGRLVFRDLQRAPPSVVIVREADHVVDIASMLIWLLGEQPIKGNFVSIRRGHGHGQELPQDREQIRLLDEIARHRPSPRVLRFTIPAEHVRAA